MFCTTPTTAGRAAMSARAMVSPAGKASLGGHQRDQDLPEVVDAQDRVAQEALGGALVVAAHRVRRQLGAQRAGDLVERRLGHAAAGEIDDAMRARRIGAEHRRRRPRLGLGVHQLRLVAIAERPRRGHARPPPWRRRTPALLERPRHVLALPRELLRVGHVLERAAAAGAVGRAHRRHARRRRGARWSRSPPTRRAGAATRGRRWLRAPRRAARRRRGCARRRCSARPAASSSRASITSFR